MFTAPAVTVKLVLLNEAIPFTAVVAVSRVMAVPEVTAFEIVIAPLIAEEPPLPPVIDATPPPAPPPLVKQVGQLI